ncbi:MAG: acyltransferase [Flavobacteriales bacterium]|nr:acyltransferase [Flavobacteriales bacterium]
MNSFKAFQEIRKQRNNFLYSAKIILRFLIIRFKSNSRIYAHSSFRISGLKNIEASDLWLGIHYRGFENSSDIGKLNIQGKLICPGEFKIGKGSRISVDKGAIVALGKYGYINSNTQIIISEGLTIGDRCAIAWNCQFLDNDFHELSIDGVFRKKSAPISIGDHVWIGSNVKIYKGVKIPSNCVVASDSVVKGVFEEENCLIAGNPAKIVRRNISWR